MKSPEEDLDTPVAGYDLKFWSQIGFRLRTSLDYEAKKVILASGIHGDKTFSLHIFEGSGTAIGAIECADGDYERHAVSQREAIDWFGRVSPEFRALVEKSAYARLA